MAATNGLREANVITFGARPEEERHSKMLATIKNRTGLRTQLPISAAAVIGSHLRRLVSLGTLSRSHGSLIERQLV